VRIIVLIKQVPETTEVQIDPVTGTMRREGVASVMNPFDSYALEEGVRVKEKIGSSIVVALSMGPPQAEATLREAVALGADEGVLLCDRALAGSDTLATGFALAQAAKSIGFDLIICGKQAIDGDTAQVGPGVAAHLDLPQATYVAKIDEISPQRIRARRLIEEGYEVLDVPLPAVITVVKEINVPRLPSLKGKMKAKKAEIRKVTVQALGIDPSRVGLAGSPTQVWKVFTPPKPKGGEKWIGEVPELVEKVYAKLKERQLV
jgi:electron transfer flavoprotein beta subunit